MHKSSGKGRFRFKLFDRAASIRLGVLLSVVLVLCLWAYSAMIWMPGQSYTAKLPPPTAEEQTLTASLEKHVKTLATDIGSRNYGRYEELNTAKTYLEDFLIASGYDVTQQQYDIDSQSYSNLIAEKTGTRKPNEIVVVGGHYDSAFNAPGANDNGTGAAATLELAKMFADKSTHRTLRFVEFTNEEPPYFWTDNMGSLVYAKQMHRKDEKVVAMLSLETMGYFSEAPGSQRYPFPVNLFYPQQGNFIAFIGNLPSGGLVRDAIASFRKSTLFPSEGVALPAWIPGIGWSDQWSFWQQGYPGIMVTDTAPYRYPHYHTEMDTPDKIDFQKLARVVTGLSQVIDDLAS